MPVCPHCGAPQIETAEDARRFAAGLLSAADVLEGLEAALG